MSDRISFEYKYVDHLMFKGDIDLSRILNELGAEGWELMYIDFINSGAVNGIFKREVRQTEAKKDG